MFIKKFAHKILFVRKLRVATYETFICFMRISPNNIHVKNIMENLMKEALIDITPANDEICLMMPQQNGGKSNKRKKVNAEKKIAKGRAHIASMSAEQKVCANALECLGFLLVYHGVLMKPVLFYIMQEKINSIGFMISSKAQHDGDLYRDPTCRSRLADVIGFMMIHPVNKMPVPINYGIALLTKFKQTDPDSNVRDNAAMNLYRAETAIHNRKDVFYFPVDYRELRDTLMFNKQTIQKFNELTNVPVNGQNVVEIDNEAMDEDANVVISDNESVEEVAVNVGIEKLNPPPSAAEVNEISDDSEPEAETQEISDDDDDIEEPEEVPALPEPDQETTKKNPTRSTRQSTADKRPSPVEQPKTSPKKQKVSDKKEEELVDEMLADFNE
jgi:proline-, glutamic acid- and leucine-rich protein 1